MKHTNIAAALAWDETPDNQEGLFLQPEEAATIDAALGKKAENEKAAEDLVAANATIAQLKGEITIATTAAVADKNRIAELEAENKKLGSQSSGTGTNLPTGGDTVIEEKGSRKITLNSPEHPLNVEAARRVAAVKK